MICSSNVKHADLAVKCILTPGQITGIGRIGVPARSGKTSRGARGVGPTVFSYRIHKQEGFRKKPRGQDGIPENGILKSRALILSLI